MFISSLSFVVVFDWERDFVASYPEQLFAASHPAQQFHLRKEIYLQYIIIWKEILLHLLNPDRAKGGRSRLFIIK